MNIAELNNKKVCILGYGREGSAMVSALEKYAPGCEITIADRNGELRIENAELSSPKHWLQLGEGWLENLNKFDMIIKSPGIPPKTFSQFSILNSQLTNSTQIFLDSIKGRGATVIGVTGSKGKSTTSSLIYAVLKMAKKDVLLIGNIGEPAIAHLEQIKKGTYVVLEMSSYQLHDLTTSPHIAVVTSLFPEHLDWHGSFDAYKKAKANITRFQTNDDIVFFAPSAADIAKEGTGRKIPFTPNDSPVAIEETSLIGEHNLSNIAAATSVTRELGIHEKIIVKAIKEFKGLPHRLEFVGTFGGIDWIDDAISTTPESTIAALDALGNKVHTIILGGQDRGNDFTSLAKRIKHSNIQLIVLFPGSGPRIKQALNESKVSAKIHNIQNMKEAVTQAKAAAGRCPPDVHPIVLLSTASPSYGMFKNFEEKGDEFQRLIRSL